MTLRDVDRLTILIFAVGAVVNVTMGQWWLAVGMFALAYVWAYNVAKAEKEGD